MADSGLILHHAFCICAFGTGVYLGYGGMVSMGGLLVAEISNFPMHLRTILRNYNLRYTKAYETCENAYLSIFTLIIVLYILARGIFCPIFLVYPCLFSVKTPLPIKIMCIAIALQSYHYIIKMVSIVKKKLKQYS